MTRGQIVLVGCPTGMETPNPAFLVWPAIVNSIVDANTVHCRVFPDNQGPVQMMSALRAANPAAPGLNEFTETLS